MATLVETAYVEVPELVEDGSVKEKDVFVLEELLYSDWRVATILSVTDEFVSFPLASCCRLRWMYSQRKQGNKNSMVTAAIT